MSGRVDSLEEVVRDAIRRAGYWTDQVWRLYPPNASGGEAEVLFVGHRMQPGAQSEPLTAYVTDGPEGEAIICSGW